MAVGRALTPRVPLRVETASEPTTFLITGPETRALEE